MDCAHCGNPHGTAGCYSPPPEINRRPFGRRKLATVQVDLNKMFFNGSIIMGIVTCLLTAYFIHGAATIVAVGLAVLLQPED